MNLSEFIVDSRIVMNVLMMAMACLSVLAITVMWITDLLRARWRKKYETEMEVFFSPTRWIALLQRLILEDIVPAEKGPLCDQPYPPGRQTKPQLIAYQGIPDSPYQYVLTCVIDGQTERFICHKHHERWHRYDSFELLKDQELVEWLEAQRQRITYYLSQKKTVPGVDL